MAGVCRLFLTTSVQYNVPEEEYGRHWNFFFTLAFLQFLTFVLTHVHFPRGRSATLSLFQPMPMLATGDPVLQTVEETLML